MNKNPAPRPAPRRWTHLPHLLCPAARWPQRKPTDACQRKASKKKKKGRIGSTSTIGEKATNSSGNRAKAASGGVTNADCKAQKLQPAAAAKNSNGRARGAPD